MQQIGTIIQLQIQRSPLKVGDGDQRVYRPDPLLTVDALHVTPEGILGRMMDGAEIMDVHYQAHPQTRYRGDNSLSLNFAAHYRLMRERFGSHLVDGAAAENILIDTADHAVQQWSAAALGSRVLIQSRVTGEYTPLTRLLPAPPCANFASFAAQERLAGGALKEALQFLDAGIRGFYCAYEGVGFAEIQPGDRVYCEA